MVGSSVVNADQTIWPLTRSRPGAACAKSAVCAWFYRFSQLFFLAEDPQARAVNDQLRAFGAVLTDKLGPLLLRDRVDKSGAAISIPSSPAMKRISLGSGVMTA
jgi:hypothetical protein